MTVVGRPSPPPCHVLREDSDLAEGVIPARREQEAGEVTVPELRLPPGGWDPWDTVRPGPIALIVLGGLLLRRVGIGGRYGAELLGQGDLLRPWQESNDGSTLPARTGWTVLESTRLAVLDDSFAGVLSRHPALAERLLHRAMQRTRQLAVNMAIVHQARVDVRLHMVLWHLASRWGRVRGDGVTLPLRLTHTVLADLVAARRPTVTSALSELVRRGVVRPLGDAWLLIGDPPVELAEIDPGTVPADVS